MSIIDVINSHAAPVKSKTEDPGVIDAIASAPGEFTKGFGRGVDTLQATLGGAAALGGDYFGLKSLSDYGRDVYNRNIAEAQQNQAAVGSYSDVSSLGTGLQYLAGGLGEVAPSILESIGTGLVGSAMGSAAAPGAGTLTGGIVGATVGKTAMKQFLKKAIRDKEKALVRAGVKDLTAGPVTKQFADEAIKTGMKGLGFTGAAMATTMPHEAGGAYMDMLQMEGVDPETAQKTAVAVGALSGLIEAGPWGMFAGKIFGEAAGKPVGKESIKRYVARTAAEFGKMMGAEGLTESAQEVIQVAGKAYADPNFDPKNQDHWNQLISANYQQVIDAGLKGMMGGGVMGAASQGPSLARSVMEARTQKQAEEEAKAGEKAKEPTAQKSRMYNDERYREGAFTVPPVKPEPVDFKGPKVERRFKPEPGEVTKGEQIIPVKKTKIENIPTTAPTPREVGKEDRRPSLGGKPEAPVKQGPAGAILQTKDEALVEKTPLTAGQKKARDLRGENAVLDAYSKTRGIPRNKVRRRIVEEEYTDELTQAERDLETAEADFKKRSKGKLDKETDADTIRALDLIVDKKVTPEQAHDQLVTEFKREGFNDKDSMAKADAAVRYASAEQTIELNRRIIERRTKDLTDLGALRTEQSAGTMQVGRPTAAGVKETSTVPAPTEPEAYANKPGEALRTRARAKSEAASFGKRVIESPIVPSVSEEGGKTKTTAHAEVISKWVRALHDIVSTTPFDSKDRQLDMPVDADRFRTIKTLKDLGFVAGDHFTVRDQSIVIHDTPLSVSDISVKDLVSAYNTKAEETVARREAFKKRDQYTLEEAGNAVTEATDKQTGARYAATMENLSRDKELAKYLESVIRVTEDPDDLAIYKDELAKLTDKKTGTISAMEKELDSIQDQYIKGVNKLAKDKKLPSLAMSPEDFAIEFEEKDVIPERSQDVATAKAAQERGPVAEKVDISGDAKEEIGQRFMKGTNAATNIARFKARQRAVAPTPVKASDVGKFKAAKPLTKAEKEQQKAKTADRLAKEAGFEGAVTEERKTEVQRKYSDKNEALAVAEAVKNPKGLTRKQDETAAMNFMLSHKDYGTALALVTEEDKVNIQAVIDKDNAALEEGEASEMSSYDDTLMANGEKFVRENIPFAMEELLRGKGEAGPVKITKGKTFANPDGTIYKSSLDGKHYVIVDVPLSLVGHKLSANMMAANAKSKTILRMVVPSDANGNYDIESPNPIISVQVDLATGRTKIFPSGHVEGTNFLEKTGKVDRSPSAAEGFQADDYISGKNPRTDQASQDFLNSFRPASGMDKSMASMLGAELADRNKEWNRRTEDILNDRGDKINTRNVRYRTLNINGREAEIVERLDVDPKITNDIYEQIAANNAANKMYSIYVDGELAFTVHPGMFKNERQVSDAQLRAESAEGSTATGIPQSVINKGVLIDTFSAEAGVSTLVVENPDAAAKIYGAMRNRPVSAALENDVNAFNDVRNDLRGQVASGKKVDRNKALAKITATKDRITDKAVAYLKTLMSGMTDAHEQMLRENINKAIGDGDVGVILSRIDRLVAEELTKGSALENRVTNEKMAYIFGDMSADAVFDIAEQTSQYETTGDISPEGVSIETLTGSPSLRVGTEEQQAQEEGKSGKDSEIFEDLDEYKKRAERNTAKLTQADIYTDQTADELRGVGIDPDDEVYVETDDDGNILYYDSTGKKVSENDPSGRPKVIFFAHTTDRGVAVKISPEEYADALGAVKKMLPSWMHDIFKGMGDLPEGEAGRFEYNGPDVSKAVVKIAAAMKTGALTSEQAARSTLAHELFHAAENFLLRPGEMRALMRRFRPGSTAYNKVVAELRNRGIDPYKDGAKEFAAEEVRAYGFQLAQEGAITLDRFENRFLNKIAEFIEKTINLVNSWLRGEYRSRDKSFSAASQVFRDLSTGKMAGRGQNTAAQTGRNKEYMSDVAKMSDGDFNRMLLKKKDESGVIGQLKGLIDNDFAHSLVNAAVTGRNNAYIGVERLADFVANNSTDPKVASTAKRVGDSFRKKVQTTLDSSDTITASVLSAKIPVLDRDKGGFLEDHPDATLGLLPRLPDNVKFDEDKFEEFIQFAHGYWRDSSNMDKNNPDHTEWGDILEGFKTDITSFLNNLEEQTGVFTATASRNNLDGANEAIEVFLDNLFTPVRAGKNIGLFEQTGGKVPPASIPLKGDDIADVDIAAGATGQGKYNKAMESLFSRVHSAIRTANFVVLMQDIQELHEATESLEGELGFNPGFATFYSGDIGNVEGAISYNNRKGAPVTAAITDGLIFNSMLTNAQIFTNSGFGKLAAGFKRLFSSATVLLPPFPLYTAVREPMWAWMAGMTDHPLDAFWRGLKEVSKDDYNVAARGMAGGYSFQSSRYFGESGSLYRPTGEIKRAIKANVSKGNVVGSVKELWELYKKYLNNIEMATREGVYLQKREQSPDASRLDINYEALNVMNFRRKGANTYITALLKIVPFLNAQIQGGYRTGTAVGEDIARKKYAYYRSAGMVMMYATMGLWFLNKGDDDYEQLPEYEKNMFWHAWIPTGEGNKRLHVKVPKPFEAGMIFGTIPEFMLDYAFDNDDNQKSFWDIKDIITKNTIEPDSFWVPQIFKPVINAVYGYDTFKDKPIVNEYLKKLPTKEQYDMFTSDTARAMADAINVGAEALGMEDGVVSPKMLDYFARSYFGRAANYALASLDMLVNPAMGYTSKPTQWRNLSKATGEFVQLEDKAQNVGGYEKFKQAFAKAESIKAMYDRAKKSHDVEAMRGMLKDPEVRKKLQQYKMLSKAKARVSKVNKAIFDVMGDVRLNGKEKRERIDALNRDIMRPLLNNVNEINQRIATGGI